jgi:uncharacterized protein
MPAGMTQPPPPPDVAAKRDRLLAALAGLPDAVVALSGGVDSGLVAKAAAVALGSRAVAVTADSPSVARRDLQAARELAAFVGIRHVVVEPGEFADPAYRANAGDRCYHCKSHLYAAVFALPEFAGWVVCSGANADDTGDYRPGLTAAAERGVRHPLQEAGFTKADVRALARWWGLPNADKPASPCLSSRLAPGVPVTPERTARVEAAEDYLRSLGVADCRVRYHDGDLARVEVPPADLPRVATPEVAAALRRLGFRFVTLDLDGLRSGSMNELVPLAVRTRFPVPR